MKKRALRLLSRVVFTIAFMLVSIKAFATNPKDLREPHPPLVTDEGILFSYKDEKNPPKYVKVIGDFNNWERSYYMIKNRYGVYVFLYNEIKKKGIVLQPGQYRYRFLVDGVWMCDPLNDKKVSDNWGTELSYFELEIPIIIAKANPVPVDHNKYIFYYKNDRAREVYLVGDFNNWNPYSLQMKRNPAGLWEAEIDIPPGSYAYILLVDGIYRKDPLGTKVVFDRFDNEYSQLKLP